MCVCTDVAARGLDLPELSLVIHADLPTNPETLLHRSGRTGRAGRKGVSVLIVPNPKRRRAEQVLNAARVSASWGPPPSVDEIRARDRERLLADPIFAEPEGEALENARALLAGMSAERVAAALLRLHAAQLPPAEELDADAAPVERREAVQPSSAFVLFRLSIGRRDKADPKWLIPLICRMGGVTKKDIGAIRIFDGETRFRDRAGRGGSVCGGRAAGAGRGGADHAGGRGEDAAGRDAPQFRQARQTGAEAAARPGGIGVPGAGE